MFISPVNLLSSKCPVPFPYLASHQIKHKLLLVGIYWFLKVEAHWAAPRVYAVMPGARKWRAGAPPQQLRSWCIHSGQGSLSIGALGAHRHWHGCPHAEMGLKSEPMSHLPAAVLLPGWRASQGSEPILVLLWKGQVQVSGRGLCHSWRQSRGPGSSSSSGSGRSAMAIPVSAWLQQICANESTLVALQAQHLQTSRPIACIPTMEEGPGAVPTTVCFWAPTRGGRQPTEFPRRTTQ